MISTGSVRHRSGTGPAPVRHRSGPDRYRRTGYNSAVGFCPLMEENSKLGINCFLFAEKLLLGWHLYEKLQLFNDDI